MSRQSRREMEEDVGYVHAARVTYNRKRLLGLGLISQQNMICMRCRPVISPLLLLIYLLTSAVLLLQPERNPWEEREGGPEIREEGGESVLTLPSIM